MKAIKIILDNKFGRRARSYLITKTFASCPDSFPKEKGGEGKDRTNPKLIANNE